MKLSDLIKTIKPLSDGNKGAHESTNPEIKSVHYRAQDVEPGGIFVNLGAYMWIRLGRYLP